MGAPWLSLVRPLSSVRHRWATLTLATLAEDFAPPPAGLCESPQSQPIPVAKCLNKTEYLLRSQEVPIGWDWLRTVMSKHRFFGNHPFFKAKLKSANRHLY